jgi:hypothetical protein
MYYLMQAVLVIILLILFACIAMAIIGCKFFSGNERSYHEIERFGETSLINTKAYFTLKKPDIIVMPLEDINDLQIPEYPFTLVCVDTDKSPGFKEVKDKVNRILEASSLRKFYCQNADIRHDKLVPIPIGLDYHTIFHKKSAANVWDRVGVGKTPVEQEKELMAVARKLPSPDKRKCAAYTSANLLHSDSGTKYHRYKNNRKQIATQFADSAHVVLETGKISRLDTWKKHGEFLFILSPPGNGIDCHRTWEALVLGNIPIVISTEMDSLFDGLPVVIIGNYDEVNPENLQKWRSEMLGKQFDYSKLGWAYWRNKILNAS